MFKSTTVANLIYIFNKNFFPSHVRSVCWVTMWYNYHDWHQIFVFAAFYGFISKLFIEMLVFDLLQGNYNINRRMWQNSIILMYYRKKNKNYKGTFRSSRTCCQHWSGSILLRDTDSLGKNCQYFKNLKIKLVIL